MTRREALRVRAYDGGASSFLGPPLATSSPVSRRMAVRMEFGMPTACGRVRFEAWAAWWWGVLDLVLDAQAGDDVGIRGSMASSASRACVSLRRGCGAVSLFGSVALRGQYACWPQRSCERCRNKHDNPLGGRASTLSGTLMRRRRASSMARSSRKMSQDDQRAKSPRIISHRRPGREPYVVDRDPGAGGCPMQ